MTDNILNESPEPTPQPKRRRWVWPAVAVAALLSGVGIGQASGDTTEPAAAPEPEVVTETVTEEVEVVPDVCLEALEVASENFTNVADMLDVWSAWYDDVFDIMDRDGLLVTAEWNDLDNEYAPQMNAIELNSDSDAAVQCRKAAGQ